jgi:hypothetical protein
VEDDPETKLAASWSDVMDVLQPLLNAAEEPDDDLMTRWRSTAAKLEAAVQAQQALPLRRAFFEFRSQAGRRFFVVDERLLALCNALLEIGPRLDNLLSVLPRTNG